MNDRNRQRSSGELFRPAVREQAKLRLLVYGPSGVGKTLGALRLAEQLGEKIALIDAEDRSSMLYADLARFDAHYLPDASVESYIEAIEAAGAAGYDVLVIDGISQEWEEVKAWKDRLDAQSNGRTTFSAWGPAGERHRKFVQAVLRCPCHVVATARAKVKYIQTEVDGKARIERVGMEPITRDGTEFEFDLVAELLQDHALRFVASRCPALDQRWFDGMWDAELVGTLREWLNAGQSADDAEDEAKDVFARLTAEAAAVDTGEALESWRADVVAARRAGLVAKGSTADKALRRLADELAQRVAEPVNGEAVEA